MGSQDRQCSRQDAFVRAGQGEEGPACHLPGREPGIRRKSLRPFHREIRHEARQGRGLPGQGPRSTARLLRLPGRAPSQPPGCAHFMDRIKGLLAFDGSTCAPRIPSRAPSLPCGCGPPKPRAACHATPRSPLQGLLALSPLEIGAKASWPLRVFELAKSAERHWRKLDGANRLGQLIEGVEFRNGEPVQEAGEKAAA